MGGCQMSENKVPAVLLDYVVIDLEMTGLRVKTDRILEVGAVRVRNGVPVAEYESLVRQECVISPEVQKLTGITAEKTAGGGPEEEVLPEFLEFLGEDVLAGQNVIFDYSFLKQWAVNHKYSFERRAVDTLKLARKFLPAEQKKDLESLCTYYGISRENAHRALDDARETQQLLERLKEEYAKKEPEAFVPVALQCKVKKQTPATEHQKSYLRKYAAYYGIAIEENLDLLTRSEASRLTDCLIAQYGKLPAGEKRG